MWHFPLTLLTFHRAGLFDANGNQLDSNDRTPCQADLGVSGADPYPWNDSGFQVYAASPLPFLARIGSWITASTSCTLSNQSRRFMGIGGRTSGFLPSQERCFC